MTIELKPRMYTTHYTRLQTFITYSTNPPKWPSTSLFDDFFYSTDSRQGDTGIQNKISKSLITRYCS